MRRYDNVMYNDILLSDICDIEEIRLPVLPSRNISTISIQSRDGDIYNGSKYNSYKIEIDILIDCDTKYECQEALNTLRDAFDVDKPKRLYINKDKYILAITEDSIDKEPVCHHSYETTIKLRCLEPYFYSDEIKVVNSNTRDFNVVNQGKRPTPPVISVGFSTDAYFAQVQCNDTGEIILVGKYPKLDLTTIANSNNVLFDECRTTTQWTNSSANINSDRTGGGTLAVNSTGESVILGTVPSGNTTWKGVCVRQNLSKSVDEFKLVARMRHNSTGQNGDPVSFKEDKETITSGSKTTYYEVTCSSLNVRTGAGTSYNKIGAVTKGYKIENGTLVNGWVKFNYNGKTGYCSTAYLTKMVSDNTVTETRKNMMAYSTKGGSGGTFLFDSPYITGKKLCTVRTGEIVRVITSKEYRHDYIDSDGKPGHTIFYKLATPYKGYMGYICRLNLLSAGNTTIDYGELDGYESADNKTGIIELYGFGVNGEQVFCAGMYDDNKYYEYTYPQATIGSRKVIESPSAPKPKQRNTSKTENGKTTVTLTDVYSGKTGDWNEYYGEWVISREKKDGVYSWSVSVNKNVDGKIVKTQSNLDIKYNDLPTTELAYVVLYIGTTDKLENSCAMSLCKLSIDELNPDEDKKGKNVLYFKQGDVLKIDCENHTCYLNEQKRDDLVDIGSRYFNLPIGESSISAFSNDSDLSTDVIFREKFIGE